MIDAEPIRLELDSIRGPVLATALGRSALPVGASERSDRTESRIGSATVTEVLSSTAIQVKREDGASTAATIAVAGTYAARVGDLVLVAEADGGALYVIGVIRALRAVVDAPTDGLVAVRDRAGRLLFEHDHESGKSVVHAPAGDLELRADHGSVSVVARDAVAVRGDRSIDLATPALTATAARAEGFFGDVRLVARSLRSAVEVVRHTAGVLEVEAQRIVERAKSTYRDVEDLAQTRAGRMRSVVATSFHVLSKKTIIKADEDLKLKGNKIHLA